eukprot:400436_1
MDLEYSSILSIIYFSVNIIFLGGLGLIVYKQGGHEVKSKTYLQDIWSQRKIYAPLLIHFYDTATDIGVIYNWYQLMQIEQDPTKDVDYKSVDMEVFFWTGITFLIVYRFCLFCWCVLAWLFGDDDDGRWYHPLLVLCDLYIFATVYESFTNAKKIVIKNAKTRLHNLEVLRQLQAKTKGVSKTKVKLDSLVDVEPVSKQYSVQFGEAILESMPQIVLQSVFMVRSANARGLNEESNVLLLMLSVIASLISISNKYVYVDRQESAKWARSIKLRRKLFPDPKCVQYWYIARVVWRLFHIMSRFCVFVLVWTVMGGAWLFIWTCVVWLCWTTIVYITQRDMIILHGPWEHIFRSLITGVEALVGVVFERGNRLHNMVCTIFKLIESVIGLSLITLFGTLSFKCGVCSDPVTRQIFTNKGNDRMLMFWVLGVLSTVVDVVLCLSLVRVGAFHYYKVVANKRVECGSW